MTATLHIEDPGLFTTVQDLGRFGAQALGVSVSGALDPVSLRLANALVGNAQEVGGLEIRSIGPRIRITGGDARIALVGTEAPIDILEPQVAQVPAGQSFYLSNNQVFRVGPMRDSATAYLGVASGLQLPLVFGSQSTHTGSGLGGLDGRSLQAGDLLPLCKAVNRDSPALGLPRPLDLDLDAPIRVIFGPQADYFDTAAIDNFLRGPYTVSPTSNRMGLRLEGTPVAHAKGYNIASDGIVTGSIQITGSGLPIVLLADRQTTGGYPKIATVISADLPKLGRAMPGQKLCFSSVSVTEAEAIRHRQEAEISDILAQLEPVQARSIESLLMSENLISGVAAD